MRDMSDGRSLRALVQRDATATKNALDAHNEDPIDLGKEVFFSRSFVEGLVAR